MHPVAVQPGFGGHALLLADERRTVVVPVIIGAAEAMVIDLRLRDESFQRPLTHDLLDTVMETLEGEVVMVQVNKLRDSTFIGSVFLWDGQEIRHVDARTSDVVAIAAGRDLPVYVHEGVVEDTGVPASEILPPGP